MSKRKLLLADDSITIQKVVNLTFADEGIDVIAVGDGNAAMEKFVELTPDLVMVDVNMPGFDGYKICEIIKQDDETKHIPVILLVGSFEPFDEEEALRVGADDYLTKPFQSIRQLVGKVTALLDAAGDKPVSNENAADSAANRNAEVLSGDVSESFLQPTSNLTAAALWGAADGDAVQTNQIGSLPVDETQKFSADFSSAEIIAASGQTVAADSQATEKDWSKTQPLDAADLPEIHSTGDAESANQNAYELADDSSETPEHNISGGQTFAGRENFDERQSSGQISTGENKSTAAGGKFFYAEIDEMNLLEVPFSDDEFYDFQDETIDEVKLAGDAPEDAQAETGDAEVSYIETPAAENSDAVREIEPMPEVFSQSDEAHPGEETQDAETYFAPPEFSQAENAATENSPPINMSPELIDAIAAKIVEKFSDNLIREIARETSTQTADLIVRKMARDISNE